MQETYGFVQKWCTPCSWLFSLLIIVMNLDGWYHHGHGQTACCSTLVDYPLFTTINGHKPPKNPIKPPWTWTKPYGGPVEMILRPGGGEHRGIELRRLLWKRDKAALRDRGT